MIKIPAGVLINKQDRSRTLLYVIAASAIADYERMQQYRPAHLDYLHNLYLDGYLMGAGPTLNDDAGFYEGDGLIILNTGSLDKAVELADQDPFHQQRVREYRVKPWLLSEGLLAQPKFL